MKEFLQPASSGPGPLWNTPIPAQVLKGTQSGISLLKGKCAWLKSLGELAQCSVSAFSWLENESTDPVLPSVEMTVTNNAAAQHSVAKGHHTTLAKYKRTGNAGSPFIQGRGRKGEDDEHFYLPVDSCMVEVLKCNCGNQK